MGESWGDSQGRSPFTGDSGRDSSSRVRPSVAEALDTDLDAYLDRELFGRTVTPVVAESAAPAQEMPTVEAPAVLSEVLPKVLELASEEETWLRELPPPSTALVMEEVAPSEVPSVEVPPASTAIRNLEPEARRGGQLLVGVLLGAAVVGTLAAGLWWVSGQRAGEARVVEVPSAKVPVAPAAPVAAVEVAPASPVVAPPPPAPVAERTEEAAPPEAQPGAAPVPVADPPVAQEAIAKAEPPTKAPRAASAEREEVPPARASNSKKQPRAVAAEEAIPEARSDYEEFDEDFARELGFTEKPKSEPRPNPKASRSVWIPPAPGEAIPERLTSADIMRVVVEHKASIAGCIQAHKARTQADAVGRLVARWSIRPDGTTAGATVETAEFQGTPLARCIEDLVRGWKFPRHRVAQQEPVRFPFTF